MFKLYLILGIIILLIIAFLYLEPIITRQKIKNNNEHGSARFSTMGEIKKNFHMEKIKNIKESGFPIWYSRNKKRVWFDMDTPHWIYLGSKKCIHNRSKRRNFFYYK